MDFAVAITNKGYYDDEIIMRGGIIHHITPKSKGILKNFNSIRKIVRKNHYECVLRTSQHSLSALELLAAWLGGAKTRVFRSSNSNTTSGSAIQMLTHKVFGFMPRCFANVKIAPSTEAAQFMFGKACVKKGKAKIIHNGIDLSVYNYNEENRGNIRQELGISDDTFILGHVGRFNQQKNHRFLLEVFKEVCQKNKNSVLLLVGKGELEKDIRKRAEELEISNNIIFTGVRSDVPALLSAMDIFVFPSLYEGMPNTVIEAQATGLPCVIADTITKEANITGLVNYLPLGDPVQWSENIIYLNGIQRKETKSDFISNGYSINSVVERFVKEVYF